jgi:hypothetical protein
VQAGPDLTAPARRAGGPPELGRSHQPQRDEHGDVGDGVEGERPAVADGRDEDGGERRPDEPRQVDVGAVERHRVGHQVAGHHLVDERPPSRVVEREQTAARHRDREEDRQRHVRQERQHGEHGRLRHLEALGQVEQMPLVHPVGDDTGPGREHQHRAELAGREQPDGDTAAGAVQHQQRQRQHGQPVAAVGDQLADEEQPEVAHPQGGERPVHPGRGGRGAGRYDVLLHPAGHAPTLCAERSAGRRR